MPQPQRETAAWGETAAILAGWAAIVAFVRPVGNFPLHDDWDFAVATWAFARTGHFHFTEFTVVSLRAQVLWGALWTRLFGESFNVLRASTLTLSAATLAVVHRTLWRAGAARFARVAGPLALLAHPIFLWASCTFMTDVPFVFASAVALYAIGRGLAEERPDLFALGCAANAVSWFVRQNGVVPLGALLVLILAARSRLTPRWRTFGTVLTAALAVFCVVALTHREWLSGNPDMFAIHYHMWGESSFRIPEQIALVLHYVGFNALNAALFFAPLVVAAAVLAVRVPRRWLVTGAIAILVVWRTADLASAGYFVPYTSSFQYSDILPGPVVYDLGVGPANLPDVFSRHFEYPFHSGATWPVVLTVAAALLTIALLDLFWTRAAAAFRSPKSEVWTMIGLAWIAAATAALCLSGYYYDRYSLDSAWPLAIVLPLSIPATIAWRKIVGATLLVVLCAFSTLAVQEHFAWNRARDDAWNALRRGGIAVNRIDGGTELEALHELAWAPRRVARRGHPPREFLLTFRPLAGYHVIAIRPFSGFFGMRRAAIYTLQKATGSSH